MKKESARNGKINEIESLVSDESEIIEIIKQIGFEECFEIKRKRTKYLLDGIAINIDYIDDLDYFIEINKTVNDKNEETFLRTNIENLLNSLGIEKENFILDSYESLILKEKYNK